MAIPAATLAILVQTQGVATTQRQLRGIHGDLGRASTNASRLGDDLDKSARKGHKSLGVLKVATAALAGVAVFDTLKRGVRSAVGEFEEARKVGAQTNAVIKSTGGVANVTAKQVATLSSAISKKAGIDDEAIQSGANLLLTFKNIRNETGLGNKIFDRSTQAITDMSAAMGQDLKSSAIQVGKALNDPIKGVTALQRVGVTFTQQQRDQITALVDSGKTLKAQKIILRELNSEFGGAATAKATSLDKLKVAAGNLAEAVGSVLVPAFDKGARFLTKLINQMIEGKSTGGAIVSVFRNVGGAAGAVVEAIRELVHWFKEHETVTLALAAAVGVLVTAFTAMKILAAVQAAIVALRVAMLALNAAFLTNPIFLLVAALAALAAAVVVAYRESETFRKIVDDAWKVIKAVAAWLITAGVKAFNAISAAVKAAWKAIDGPTRAIWGGIKVFLRDVIWGPLKTIATIYFTAYKTIIVTTWKVIKTVTETVWAAIKTILTTAWNVLKTVATTAWDAIKLAVLTPIRTARDTLKTIWDAIKTVATGAWGGIKKAIKAAADPILDVILAPFKSAVKGVAKFAKLILQVIGKIPGVDTKGPVSAIDKFTNGLAKGGVFQAFAHGGAFARTGGLVRAPITLMGEEAPRHPEYVIPTNPAHRKRAHGLLAQAAGAIGFATGGRFSIPDMGQLWLGQGGRGDLSDTMGVIGWAESRGDPNALNPSGAKGLWQILGQLVPGNLFDPAVNARNAIAKYNLQGLHAWDASRSVWGPLLGQSGSLGEGKILDAINPLKLIGKLPGVGDLPDWLGGMGKYVLSKVGDYIKGAVTGVFAGGDASASQRLSTMVAFANVLESRHIPYGPQGHSGWAINALGEDCSSSVSKVLHAGGFLDQVLTTVGLPGALAKGPGKMVTVHDRALPGAAGHTIIQLGNRFFGTSGQNAGGGPGWITAANGYLSTLPTKLHPPGMAAGGMYGGGGLPFIGSYHSGGVAPREGLAHVSAGERMTPAGGGGPLVHIENAQFGSRLDANSMAERLAFRIATAG